MASETLGSAAPQATTSTTSPPPRSPLTMRSRSAAWGPPGGHWRRVPYRTTDGGPSGGDRPPRQPTSGGQAYAPRPFRPTSTYRRDRAEAARDATREARAVVACRDHAAGAARPPPAAAARAASSARAWLRTAPPLEKATRWVVTRRPRRRPSRPALGGRVPARWRPPARRGGQKGGQLGQGRQARRDGAWVAVTPLWHAGPVPERLARQGRRAQEVIETSEAGLVPGRNDLDERGARAEPGPEQARDLGRALQPVNVRVGGRVVQAVPAEK